MDQQVTPSLVWPTRTAPLEGTELLLKQNKDADSTPDPKEELLPTALILQYILSNLPDGLVQVSGGTVSDSQIILHRTNNVDIVIDASELATHVTGGTYSNGTLGFTNSTGGTFEIDVAELATYVTGGTYSNGFITFTNTTGGTFDVDMRDFVDDYEALTVGSSTISYKGRGVTASIVSGHITITVASGGRITELSLEIANSDMGYTDGNYITNNGVLVTIDNSANTSSVTLMRPTRIWKKAFGGAISTTNPGQAQNPLDTNEVVYSVSGGIFTVGWDDAQANYPSGMLVAM